ncbi:unnamed protein product [Prorocentrum cordatum]|uniref:Transmembrane protein 14C n=1 Tax=Prorocentrum cordatum TaxID=2364126 RepID=A0ABN9T9V9_9DINO|nr:unnamed protein product [Polarella glacialis]
MSRPSQDRVAGARQRGRETAPTLAQARAARTLAARGLASEMGTAEGGASVSAKVAVEEVLFEVEVDEEFLSSADALGTEGTERELALAPAHVEAAAGGPPGFAGGSVARESAASPAVGSTGTESEERKIQAWNLVLATSLNETSSAETRAGASSLAVRGGKALRWVGIGLAAIWSFSPCSIEPGGRSPFNSLVGVLLATGGTVAYSRKGSLPSLIGGVGCGVALLSTNALAPRRGFKLGALVSFLLTAGMLPRAVKSGKFMPAGAARGGGSAARGLVSALGTLSLLYNTTMLRRLDKVRVRGGGGADTAALPSSSPSSCLQGTPSSPPTDAPRRAGRSAPREA